MLAFVLWILFAMLEGSREGGHFSYGNSKYPFNIHIFFVPVRALIALAFILMGGMWFDIFAYILVFPFFHDGAYYQTRHFLDVKRYNFFSQSTSTTAKLSLNARNRIVCVILGITLFLLTHL